MSLERKTCIFFLEWRRKKLEIMNEKEKLSKIIYLSVFTFNKKNIFFLWVLQAYSARFSSSSSFSSHPPLSIQTEKDVLLNQTLK